MDVMHGLHFMMGWKDLKDIEKNALVELRDYTAFELETKLAILMDASDVYLTSLKVGSMIDACLHIVLFCNEHKLNDDLYEYLFKLFIRLMENLENGVSVEDNIMFFQRDLMTFYATAENSTDKVKEVKTIIDDMIASIFQHHNLYKYLFTCEQEVQERTHEIVIEAIPSIDQYPAPLEQSIHEEWYNRFINPIPPEEEIEEVPETEAVDSIANTAVDEVISNVEARAEYLLASIDKDELKRLVNEVAKEKLLTVKVDLESKIADKETSFLKSFSKLTIN